jgi:RNA polymerase sigma-70 factor (ECF subfamily)
MESQQDIERMLGEARPRLEAHIRMRLGPHLRREVSPEDVYQETLARALKSLPQCRADDEESFFRWLRGIAEHVILNLARRQRGDKLVYIDHDAPVAGPTPSKLLRREERFERLREALDALEPDYREVVYLVRIEGLKIKEAAERMNRSPKAVMHLLGRALKKLKETFGDTESLSLPPRRLVNGGERNDS